MKKRRMRFSAAVLEACAQLREYSEFFNEEKNRRKIQEDHGLLAFKPKMFVIIGRRGDVNPIDVRKMESDFPNLNLRTYDDSHCSHKGESRSHEKGDNMKFIRTAFLTKALHNNAMQPPANSVEFMRETRCSSGWVRSGWWRALSAD